MQHRKWCRWIGREPAATAIPPGRASTLIRSQCRIRSEAASPVRRRRRTQADQERVVASNGAACSSRPPSPGSQPMLVTNDRSVAIASGSSPHSGTTSGRPSKTGGVKRQTDWWQVSKALTTSRPDRLDGDLFGDRRADGAIEDEAIGTTAFVQSINALPRNAPASAPPADSTSAAAGCSTATRTTSPNSAASAKVPLCVDDPSRSASTRVFAGSRPPTSTW
ncbi:hypothetical protein A8926_7636 [Saccharopolyspora spinosa]|uniref:Uncharacterized protein n=1 Tax=Saccharopolyspora spinosa TaxID=60894 RepID=A0A2N3Y974_SACSN|nr:hypothetical protein A8926_7636 [Saccharopolyspora spinosa]